MYRELYVLVNSSELSGSVTKREMFGFNIEIDALSSDEVHRLRVLFGNALHERDTFSRIRKCYICGTTTCKSVSMR